MNLKQSLLSMVTIMVVLYACTAKKETGHDHSTAHEETSVDTVKKSIPKEEHAMIGKAHMTIKYTAPAVRGRVIWGGLVALDQVWVTGAHRATSLEIDKDFDVNGTVVAAGKYALFTIPGKDKWTFIINKKWDQHLADEYDQKDDVVRAEVDPETTDSVQERLNFTIQSDDATHAKIVFAWEKIKVTLPITIK
jgi:hypothetical protein